MTIPKIEKKTGEFQDPAKKGENEMIEPDEAEEVSEEPSLTEELFFELVEEMSPDDWKKVNELTHPKAGIRFISGAAKQPEVLNFLAWMKRVIESGVRGKELLSAVRKEMVNDKVSGQDLLESMFVANKVLHLKSEEACIRRNKR